MVNAMNAIIDWAGSTDSTDKFPDATRSFLDTLNKLMECNLCSFVSWSDLLSSNVVYEVSV